MHATMTTMTMTMTTRPLARSDASQEATGLLAVLAASTATTQEPQP